jgi:RNA polymerase sigma-70 factor, ECF subfamily
VTSRSRAADESGRGGDGFADRRRKAGAREGDEESDNDLATRASAGDRAALEFLLDRHADRIHAVCRRILGDPEDALDATQEAMIAVARGIAHFDRRSAFSTWLYRVATNAALDEGRRKARRPRPVEPPAEAVVTPSPEDAVGARLDVDAALGALPDEFRVAVVLRDLCDLDYAEIADVLGVPAGTVRSRIARGRAALAEALGNRGRAAERPTSETRPTGT